MAHRNLKYKSNIDFGLLLLYFLIVGVGLLSIYSVTFQSELGTMKSFWSFSSDFSKQLYFAIASLFIGLFILQLDSKVIASLSLFAFLFCIFLLLLCFVIPNNVRGSHSFLKLGGFQFQPAELTKLAVCLMLAKYISNPEVNFHRNTAKIKAILIFLTPCIIIFLQNESGLALVFLAFIIVLYREGLSPIILFTLLFLVILAISSLLVNTNILSIVIVDITILAIYLFRKKIKADRSILYLIIFVALASIAIQRYATPFVFKHVLKIHQTERIYSMLGKKVPDDYIKLHLGESGLSENKKKSSNYNVMQSKIAIGNGQFWGKGIFKGTQTRFGFVPEQRTDFIFDTIGEGFGFVGSVGLLLIYFLMLFRIFIIAERQRNIFSRVYAYGVFAILCFHIIVNIAMTIGLMPVIGIPLPFMSYGGTSLLTFSMMIFIVLRFDADRLMVIR